MNVFKKVNYLSTGALLSCGICLKRKKNTLSLYLFFPFSLILGCSRTLSLFFKQWGLACFFLKSKVDVLLCDFELSLRCLCCDHKDFYSKH